MDTNERKEKAAQLLALVRANPDNPSAGQFAQAAADLLQQCDEHEKQAHIREKAPELIDLVRQMTEVMNRKPPTPPTTTAEQSVNQTIARSVASALIQGAVELEQTAAMGASRHMGGLSVGAGLAPLLGEDECAKLRARAREYRARAIAVLTEAGLNEVGSLYPMVAGCA